MAAFLRVMQVLHTRVCLVIDGLDEYEGDEIKKADLAELMTWLVGHSNVKVVASSRPLRVFESRFSVWPCLAVHDLTMKDIATMVAGKLRSKPHVQQLIKAEPVAVQDLIWQIGLRSSGVFLWAVWAVKIILDGVLYEDSLEDFPGRFDDLPPELEELFDTMLNRIPRRFEKEGLRYLLLAVYGHVNDLSIYADDMAVAADAVKTPEAFWKGEMPAPDYMERKIDRFSRRLYSATQGLLDFEQPYHEVHFMHKSVAYFLLDNTSMRWKEALEEQRDSTFDPGVALTVARVMRLRLSASTAHNDDDDEDDGNDNDDDDDDDNEDEAEDDDFIDWDLTNFSRSVGIVEE